MCGKSMLVVLMAVVGAQAIKCYSGEQQQGNVAPKDCDSGVSYCVTDVKSFNDKPDVLYFCGDDLWCPKNGAGGDNYTCCNTDLCNAPDPSAPTVAPTTAPKNLECYSGNQNDGTVTTTKCGSGYSFCFVDTVYPTANSSGNVYGGCDNGLWCNQVINQTGSSYTCCQTSLCNVFPPTPTGAPSK